MRPFAPDCERRKWETRDEDEACYSIEGEKE